MSSLATPRGVRKSTPALRFSPTTHASSPRRFNPSLPLSGRRVNEAGRRVNGAGNLRQTIAAQLFFCNRRCVQRPFCSKRAKTVLRLPQPHTTFHSSPSHRNRGCYHGTENHQWVLARAPIPGQQQAHNGPPNDAEGDPRRPRRPPEISLRTPPELQRRGSGGCGGSSSSEFEEE